MRTKSSGSGKKGAKPKSLKDVLSLPYDRKWHGGPGCQTCTHKNAKKIIDDCAEFLKEKRAGNLMPWGRFIAIWLKPQYGYPFNAHTLFKHMDRCLGIKDIPR